MTDPRLKPGARLSLPVGPGSLDRTPSATGTYTAPGVYVEEIHGGPPPVAEVATGIPAFLGWTGQAPGGAVSPALVPTPVGSLAEYEARFGAGHPLHGGLSLYFANGGGRCWVVPLGDARNPPSLGDESSGLLGGLRALEAVAEPALLAAPEAALVPDAADLFRFHRAALAHCARAGNRFALLDLRHSDDPDRDAAEFRAAFGPDTRPHRRYGAAYVPWLLPAAGGPPVPPSGAAAGICAATDRTRGVWKAPANVALAGVNGPAVVIDDARQERLHLDPGTGLSINVIRLFPGKGTLVWGARTLAGDDNEWRYVPVRRFVSMVEASLRASLGWAAFEPNGPDTWVRVRSTVENYLATKWREGALQGARPEQAYFVQAGLGTTMTAEDVRNGRLLLNVGLALVRPAEFLILRLGLAAVAA